MNKELEKILENFDVKDWKKLESLFLKQSISKDYSFEEIMKRIIEAKQKDLNLLKKRIKEFERLGNMLKNEKTSHGIPNTKTFMAFKKLLEDNE